MPYLISDIRKGIPKANCKYLFDANVWLAVLDPTFNSYHYNPYLDFFNSIINNTHVNNAEIVIPALLLSEVLNRLINDIYYEEFKYNNPPLPGLKKREHYKNFYRADPQYAIDMEMACSSIRAYHQKIKFISDNLDIYTCKTLIKKIPVHLDVNDYIFAKIALQQNLIVVTNDKDFSVEDVSILTTRKELISL